LSSLARWVQGNGSWMVLTLTYHQCSIHYKSSHMTHRASKQICKPFIIHWKVYQTEHKQNWNEVQLKPWKFDSKVYIKHSKVYIKHLHSKVYIILQKILVVWLEFHTQYVVQLPNKPATIKSQYKVQTYHVKQNLVDKLQYTIQTLKTALQEVGLLLSMAYQLKLFISFQRNRCITGFCFTVTIKQGIIVKCYNCIL